MRHPIRVILHFCGAGGKILKFSMNGYPIYSGNPSFLPQPRTLTHNGNSIFLTMNWIGLSGQDLWITGWMCILILPTIRMQKNESIICLIIMESTAAAPVATTI